MSWLGSLRSGIPLKMCSGDLGLYLSRTNVETPISTAKHLHIGLSHEKVASRCACVPTFPRSLNIAVSCHVEGYICI